MPQISTGTSGSGFTSDFTSSDFGHAGIGPVQDDARPEPDETGSDQVEVGFDQVEVGFDQEEVGFDQEEAGFSQAEAGACSGCLGCGLGAAHRNFLSVPVDVLVCTPSSPLNCAL